MKRGTKFWVKGYEGTACGPFRWTAVREWIAIGYLSPDDEVRQIDESTWSRVGAMPDLLATPPGSGVNEALNDARARAREKKPIGPRAAAYLRQLGCPIRPEKLNPYAAYQWVRILEELNPPLVNATEGWAAEEESHDRVPAASANDATPAQLEILRALGREVPGNLTRLEAQRLISGPPTEGQLRRLKFYGITLPEGAGKDEASERIDRYMRENWDSEALYQASRRTLGADGTEGQKPATALRLRQSPPPAFTELNASPALRSSTRGNFPAPETPPPPARRSRTPLYLLVACLIGFGIFALRWSDARKKSGADSPPMAPSSTHQPEQGTPLSEAELARTVTLLESPNPASAEQLRKFALSLPLTGFMGGPEPRALIDGRMYQVGDAIDKSRGVFVVHVDPIKHVIVLGDAAGSIVQRVLK